ncbi:MAG: Hfq-like protein [Terriglobales bacterium]
MASSSESAARRPEEPDIIANRKLIRPSLSEVREQLAKGGALAAGTPAAPAQAMAARPPHAPHVPHAAHAGHAAPAAPPRTAKKPIPPDQTNAENFYYIKQMQTKTPMVLVLQDGERINGIIEWYDRSCLKIHRTDGPNLLIYKANIKYLFKAEDETANGAE